jgi:hypothetical protein
VAKRHRFAKQIPKNSWPISCVILSGVWRDSQGIAQESDNPHAVEFLFCGAAKQKREHRERDLAWSFGGFCGKCYFAYKSYCISFADPAAADALRFCLFGQALKAQKFDAGCALAQDDTLT